MYDINQLIKKEKELKEFYKSHFVKFFKGFSYKELNNKQIKAINIDSYDSISSLRYGSGFYLILTDYMSDKNACTFKINGLKAIYRGHGIRIRKRVESHLFNSLYNKNQDNTDYTVCMKLNDDNGINITEDPYSKSKWVIVQHAMTNSSKIMREQTEQAFDEIYEMPVGSNA